MADGVRLACACRCPEGSPAVLFVHGFGQTRGAWTASAEALSRRGWRTLCIDLRGHGQSGRSPGGHYDMQQFFDDVATVARAQPEPPVLVGASMGGLLGLAVAGECRPAPFAALVLVDITPRWERAGVQRILAFMRAHPEGFGDLDEASRAVAAYLPQRARRKGRAQLEPLLRKGADGRLRWHWDPAMLAPIVGQGERYQARLEQAARAVAIPTLLLSGENSDVVSRRTIGDFLARVPHARHVEVAGATHMLAGDANDAFTQAIERFIDSVFPTTTCAGVAG